MKDEDGSVTESTDVEIKSSQLTVETSQRLTLQFRSEQITFDITITEPSRLSWKSSDKFSYRAYIIKCERNILIFTYTLRPLLAITTSTYWWSSRLWQLLYR